MRAAKDRATLARMADGKCQICGRDLVKGWNADHVKPWSLGGETAIENMQALCPKCNQSKGANYVQLRAWQRRAAEECMASTDFFLEATPGAGKTKFACHMSKLRLAAGCRRVIAVVPTRALKKQWQDDFHEFGIDADYFDNGVGIWPRDMQAICVTYNQVGYDAPLFRGLCAQQPTHVILDEIHHCGYGEGKDLAWGKAVKHAFELARYRLCMSGTPFRTPKNERIPFLNYVDGQSRPDFTYGYGEALSDGVCRYIEFPKRGGKAEWATPRGQHRVKTFDDELPDDEEAQRLRTALTTGEWMPETLADAHRQLMEYREEDEDAAGLVICIDCNHAKFVVKSMRDRLGVNPVVATSDEPEALAAIAGFKESRQPWIVAVRMVSEGVDIPRLRIGVYATVTRTEMFFRQAVGRFVRRQADHIDHTAQLFIPDDPSLREFAEKIREERRHVEDEEIQDQLKRERDHQEAAQSEFSHYLPIASTAEDKGTVLNGEVFSPEELEVAASLAAETERVSVALVASILRRARDRGLAPPAESATTAAKQPKKADEKKRLKELNNRLSRRIAATLGAEFKNVNADLNRRSGIKSVTTATVDELKRRADIAIAWVEEISGEQS